MSLSMARPPLHLIPPNPKPAQPFVAWMGGKRRLTGLLMEHMPAEYSWYVEAFCGGGALFWALNRRRASALVDTNPDLMTTYAIVQMEPKALIAALGDLELQYCASDDKKAFHRKISQQRKGRLSLVGIAARCIFLTKTSFGGKWRTNQQGKFNTCWSGHENQTIYDADNIMRCSEALQYVELRCDSYHKELRELVPKEGGFVYLDPPYHGVHNQYGSNRWGDNDQHYLSRFCAGMDRAGVKWMLSNSDTPLIREWYKGFAIHEIQAGRALSCRAEGSGAVTELLIKNY